MIKKLIVNADDFGLSKGCTLGIILGHKEGIITSTTIMMNMPDAKWSCRFLMPELGVGIHLNITAGSPLTNGQSFCNSQGEFKKRSDYHGRIIVDKEELYREWKAHIELYIKTTGRMPDHLDSHHHIHLMDEYQDIIFRLSDEYNLPFRQEKCLNDKVYAKFIASFNGDHADMKTFKEICEQNDETIELMTHSALIDQRLLTISSYNLPRAKELDFLMSKKVKNYLKKNHITLTNYSYLYTPE